MVGVFNCNYHKNEGERTVISGTISPADVPGLAGTNFIAYAHRKGRTWRCGPDSSIPISLSEGDWEVISFAPVERGVAVLGLADKLNSTSAVLAKKWRDDSTLTVTLHDGGKFLAWSEHPPGQLWLGKKSLPFVHDPAAGNWEADVPVGGRRQLTINW